LIQKYKTSADGLKTAAELPKNATELVALIEHCERVRLWLGHIDFCVMDPVPITKFFRRDPPRDGNWKIFLTEGSTGSTLIRK
jgi:hypothetical protein